jgi:hypothetical protein
VLKKLTQALNVMERKEGGKLMLYKQLKTCHPNFLSFPPNLLSFKLVLPLNLDDTAQRIYIAVSKIIFPTKLRSK